MKNKYKELFEKMEDSNMSKLEEDNAIFKDPALKNAKDKLGDVKKQIKKFSGDLYKLEQALMSVSKAFPNSGAGRYADKLADSVHKALFHLDDLMMRVKN